ncbi:hypothetical protein [Qipengyuania sediminis]|uniref:hypothetical protein n=1 Tax=Qipengyuania sediminis TaxID=1532023 RepID=UPI00197E0525|nr:hypothetical protein [Qipengyuania sediminis]
MTRIALIGNMNNNHFALMRHLRDLGADAHLFLYANEHDHFLPQCDTAMWDRWRPFVHQLGVSNGGRDVFYRDLGPLARRLGDFEALLGNGIAPVLCQRIGRRLDMFVPYCDGGEFIVEHEWKWRKPLASTYTALRKRAMEHALRDGVDAIVTANRHEHSLGTFRRLQVPTVDMFIPMLYAETSASEPVMPAELQQAAERMDRASLAVFSHVSHFWKTLPVARFMGGVGKRNQWLIEGFARYVGSTGDRAALLVMVEYGPDVAASKALIGQLGIADQIIWLPLMTRLQIMRLLDHAHVGGSEFAGMLWGGAGWEFLSKGVPMLHYLENESAYALPDRPLPPFLNCASAEEIARALLTHDRAALRRMGECARAWYERYQGQALAARYLGMLAEAAQRRRQEAAH